MFNIRRLVVVTSGVLLAVSASAVAAAVPGNDEITNPISIAALPYANTQDTSDATTGSTDPDCYGRGPTVWYQFTAIETGWLEANTFGSDYDTTLYVGTPDGAGGMVLIGCNDDSSSVQSRIRFEAVAGTTYLMMVGSYADGAGGALVFNLAVAEPFVPLSLSVSINPLGAVVHRGRAQISGLATCTGTDSVELTLYASETGTLTTVRGEGFAIVECSPDGLQWSANVRAYSSRFHAGRATAMVRFFTCGEEECTGDWAMERVRLLR